MLRLPSFFSPSLLPTFQAKIKYRLHFLLLCRFIQDPQVRVVVITGAGKYFCTGMDLGSSNQKNMQERVGTNDGVAASVQIYETLKACPKPIITKINGGALGGGFGLVFTSDIRIASKKAWFWFAEVCPEGPLFGPWLLFPFYIFCTLIAFLNTQRSNEDSPH
ncbi:hydroxymethylglutaryl-CoA lyase, variant 3 [Balamuthia mandrillaris]